MEKGWPSKHVLLKYIEGVAGVIVLNAERKDWARCTVEDMTKLHAKPNGWITQAVEGPLNGPKA